MIPLGSIIQEIVNPYKRHNEAVDKRIQKWVNVIKYTRLTAVAIAGITLGGFFTDRTFSNLIERKKYETCITESIKKREYTNAHFAIIQKEKERTKHLDKKDKENTPQHDLSYILSSALTEKIPLEKAQEYISQQYPQLPKKNNAILRVYSKKNSISYATSLEKIITQDNSEYLVVGYSTGELYFTKCELNFREHSINLEDSIYLSQIELRAFLDNQITGKIFPATPSGSDKPSHLIVGSSRGIIYNIDLQDYKPITEIIYDHGINYEGGTEISELRSMKLNNEEVYLFQSELGTVTAINQQGKVQFRALMPEIGQNLSKMPENPLPIAITQSPRDIPLILVPYNNSIRIYNTKGDLIKRISLTYTITSELLIPNIGTEKYILASTKDKNLLTSDSTLVSIPLQFHPLNGILLTPDVNYYSLSTIKYPAQRWEQLDLHTAGKEDIIITGNEEAQIIHHTDFYKIVVDITLKPTEIVEGEITSPPITIPQKSVADSTQNDEPTKNNALIVIPSSKDKLYIYKPLNQPPENSTANTSSKTNAHPQIIELQDAPGYDRMKYFTFQNPLDHHDTQSQREYLALANSQGIYLIGKNWFIHD